MPQSYDTIRELEESCFEEYKKAVKESAENKSEDLIPNGGVEHAQVVIENLFNIARKNINIFSGQLNHKVYAVDNIVSSIDRFFNKTKGTLRILLQEKDVTLENNDLIKLCREFSGRSEIKVVTDQEDKKRNNHFITVDDKAYRYEPDKNLTDAIVCFNAKEFVVKVNKVFNDLFKRGENYDDK